MEHILPKAAGGGDESENLAASCYRCNEFKGAKTHTIDLNSTMMIYAGN
ncbi:MAG: HNH endonuclease [Rivularia sp. (in: cyanobacteria)]